MNLPTWINPIGAVWFPIFYAIIGSLVSMAREDNTACPIVLSPKARIIFATALGVVQTVLQQHLGGLSWAQSILTAILSVGAALGAHGFRSFPTLPPAATVAGGKTEPAPPPSAPSVPGVLRRWMPESGLARMVLAVGTVLCGFTALCAFLSACTPAETAVEKQLANCIVAEYSKDIGAGMSAENAALDTAAYCITTELEVKQTMKSVNADALARHSSSSDAGTDH